MQNTVFLTNCVAGTSKSNLTATKLLYKHLNKNKPNAAKTWLGHFLHHPAGNESSLFNSVWSLRGATRCGGGLGVMSSTM